MVTFSTDSEPQARPGIDLMVPFEPEPEKEVESERIVRIVEEPPPPPPEASEKTEVLSRIANLRKEISEDDRYVKDTLKLRHEAKEKAAAVEEARRKRQEAREAEAELVDVSDEDLPAERDLKLRKPERRGGLKSRNPHGLESRREREVERGPLDMVRGAHMDREDRGRLTEEQFVKAMRVSNNTNGYMSSDTSRESDLL